MKKKIIITIIIAVASITASAQLFRPLGLGLARGEYQGELSQPRMHVEGDKLYVCTSQGLYAKDLTNEGSGWQQAGFAGIPLQDYARRGSDILALRYNQGGGFLLLSHDGGQTYEDVTPDIFCHEKYEILANLVQHPTDPSTLLVSSFYHGILRSMDFGQTWEQLTDFLFGNAAASFIGFHPTQPSIIYNSGEGNFFNGHIAISYDDGKTWNHYDTYGQGDKDLGFPGENCVHRPAFHPTNPDRWIAGGEGCVYLSDNNGQTWSCQNYMEDKSRVAYWFFTAFDDEHPDTVYMAGILSECIKLMCSTDGGRTWYQSQLKATDRRPDIGHDLLQYHDRLFIYTETDIYEVSKADLIAQSTAAIHSVTFDNDTNTPTYDLQGRQVAEPKHGIFIKNRRKIVK